MHNINLLPHFTLLPCHSLYLYEGFSFYFKIYISKHLEYLRLKSFCPSSLEVAHCMDDNENGLKAILTIYIALEELYFNSNKRFPVSYYLTEIIADDSWDLSIVNISENDIPLNINEILQSLLSAEPYIPIENNDFSYQLYTIVKNIMGKHFSNTSPLNNIINIFEQLISRFSYYSYNFTNQKNIQAFIELIFPLSTKENFLSELNKPIIVLERRMSEKLVQFNPSTTSNDVYRLTDEVFGKSCFSKVVYREQYKLELIKESLKKGEKDLNNISKELDQTTERVRKIGENLKEITKKMDAFRKDQGNKNYEIEFSFHASTTIKSSFNNFYSKINCVITTIKLVVTKLFMSSSRDTQDNIRTDL